MNPNATPKFYRGRQIAHVPFRCSQQPNCLVALSTYALIKRSRLWALHACVQCMHSSSHDDQFHTDDACVATGCRETGALNVRHFFAAAFRACIPTSVSLLTLRPDSIPRASRATNAGMGSMLYSHRIFRLSGKLQILYFTIFCLTYYFNTRTGMVFVLIFVWPFEYSSRKCCACIEGSNGSRCPALYWMGIL